MMGLKKGALILVLFAFSMIVPLIPTKIDASPDDDPLIQAFVGEGVNTGVNSGSGYYNSRVLCGFQAYADSVGRRYVLTGFETLDTSSGTTLSSYKLKIFMCPNGSDPLVASSWVSLDLGTYSEGYMAEINSTLMMVFARYYYRSIPSQTYLTIRHAIFRIQVNDTGMSILNSQEVESLSLYASSYAESVIWAFQSQSDAVAVRSFTSRSSGNNIRIWRVNASSITDSSLSVDAPYVYCTGFLQHNLNEDWIFYSTGSNYPTTDGYRVKLTGLTWGSPISAAIFDPTVTASVRYAFHYSTGSKSYSLIPYRTSSGVPGLGYYDDEWNWNILEDESYTAGFCIDGFRQRLLIAGVSRLYNLTSSSFINGVYSGSTGWGGACLMSKTLISVYDYGGKSYQIFGEGIYNVQESGGANSPIYFYWAYYAQAKNTPSIENLTAPSSVYASQTVNLDMTVYDADGRNNLKNATLSLSGGIDLIWVEDNNATSIIDPHNYADLVSSTITVVSAQKYKISWQVRFNWNYAKGYVDAVGTVFDDDDLSNSSERPDFFYFEKDLKICADLSTRDSITLDRDCSDIGYDIFVDSTGIYVVGTSDEGSNGDRIELIKYSLDRTQQWNKTFGEDGYHYEGVAITKNDGYLYIAGYVYDYSHTGITSALIMKCDTDGNQIWNKTWCQSNQEDIFNDVEVAGNYIYAAGKTGYGYYQQKALLVKFDLDGNQIWNATWSNPYAFYMGVAVDGSDIYTAGYYYSEYYNYDWVLAKYDSDGNRLWIVSWGDADVDDVCNDVTVGGGYVYACGHLGSYGVLVKFDTSGNQIWNSTYNMLSSWVIFNRLEFDNDMICCVGLGYIVDMLSMATVCYNDEGVICWEAIDYLNPTEVSANGVSIYDGNAYVVGYAYNSTTGCDLVIPIYTIALTISPSQSISLSGKICYYGTITPPYNTTGLTAGVELGGVVKSSTTINPDGSFTLPTFNGPSTPGSYVYTIFCDSSVQNMTMKVTVSGSQLTTVYLRAIPTSININQNELSYINGYLTLTLGGSDGISGKTIYLQKFIDGGWDNVTSAVTNSYGHVVFPITEGSWGTYIYRLKFFGDETYNEATSSLVTVNVKSGGGYNPPPSNPPPDTDTWVADGDGQGGHVIYSGRWDTLTIRINSTQGFTLVGIDFYGDYSSWVTLITEIPIHSVYSEENGYHYVDVVIKVFVPRSVPEGSYEIQYIAHIIYDKTGQEDVIVGIIKILVKALPEITFEALGFAALLSVFIIPLVWRRKKREGPLDSGPIRDSKL